MKIGHISHRLYEHAESVVFKADVTFTATMPTPSQLWSSAAATRFLQIKSNTEQKITSKLNTMQRVRNEVSII